MQLFQYTVPYLVTTGGLDDLLHVQVLQRQRIQVALFPALAGNRQFPVPLAVSPLRVLVTQALHAMHQDRFQLYLQALTGPVIHGDHG